MNEQIRVDGFFLYPPRDIARTERIVASDPRAWAAVVNLLLMAFGQRWPCEN